MQSNMNYLTIEHFISYDRAAKKGDLWLYGILTRKEIFYESAVFVLLLWRFMIKKGVLSINYGTLSLERHRWSCDVSKIRSCRKDRLGIADHDQSSRGY
jgi:hypothetical protein